MTDKPEVPEKVYMRKDSIPTYSKSCEVWNIEFIPVESLKELRGVWKNYIEGYDFKECKKITIPHGIAIEIFEAIDNLARKMGWPRLVSNETKDDGVKNE